MTPRSWEPWVERYTARGHHVVAPGWPGVGSDPEQIRRDPTPLEGLGIAAIVDHYDAIVRGLERPPIIIGHSFGGLFTQILLDRGLGAAGVALGSAPPKGVVLLPYSSLRAAWPGLRNPLKRSGLAPLTREQFHWAFTNTLTKDASDAVYEQQYIPGTSRAFFEAASANLNPRSAAKIDFGNATRAPLLLVVGGKDRISPPSVNRTLLKLQRRAASVTESKEFPARSHYTAGEDGWEEVADYALDWTVQHAHDGAAGRA